MGFERKQYIKWRLYLKHVNVEYDYFFQECGRAYFPGSSWWYIDRTTVVHLWLSKGMDRFLYTDIANLLKLKYSTVSLFCELCVGC